MFYKVLFVSLFFITTVSSNVTAGENYLCISNAAAELPKNAQKLLILDQNNQQELAYIDETTFTLSETNGVLAGQSKTNNSFIIFQSNVLELISGNNTWKGSCRKLSENNTVSSTVKSKKKTCNEDVTACTNKQLCTKGTRKINNLGKQWDWREKYKKFGAEARKRGLSCGTDKKKSSSVQNSKIIECKMVVAFNTNGTMREKEYFRIKNGNIEYNKWNWKKKRGEWLKTNKKSDGKFKWFVKRPYNSNNLTHRFKVSFDLETDVNMQNILLKTLLTHNGGGMARYSSKGKCKIYKG